jgi:hypothetical protein
VPARAGVLDHDVLDGVAANVVVTAKIRACSQEPPQGAVIECGECFGER